jgi:hypothetical protein
VVHDEHVERSERIDRDLDDALRCDRVGEVRLDEGDAELTRDRLRSAGLGSPGLFRIVRRPSLDEDPGARGEEAPGDCKADPRAPADAGDESVSPREVSQSRCAPAGNG